MLSKFSRSIPGAGTFSRAMLVGSTLAIATVFGGLQFAIADDTTYELKYKLQPGQIIESEVTHLAKTDTRINKTEQSSQSRSISSKAWEVTEVDASGNMTFIYRIDRVDMSQQIGDNEEMRYNSEKDTVAPKVYAKVAESIGKPITTITIDSRGQVVKRNEGKSTSNLGMGDVALVMPAKGVKIGEEWTVTREVKTRLDDGGQKGIQVRETYTLEKVSAGIATIKIESKTISPLDDPAVEAQVLQQLSNGTFKFDIDAGHMVSKELKWNESVVDFSGAGSLMEYTARYNEEVKEVKTKSKQAAKKGSATR